MGRMCVDVVVDVGGIVGEIVVVEQAAVGRVGLVERAVLGSVGRGELGFALEVAGVVGWVEPVGSAEAVEEAGIAEQEGTNHDARAVEPAKPRNRGVQALEQEHYHSWAQVTVQ